MPCQGITEALTTVKTYTTVNYWAVSDVNTAGYITNVSAWCSTCHTRYLAGSGSSSTDSTDAIFRYRHTSNAANEGGPSCIKCHVSHGSNAAMSGTASAAAGLVNPGTTTNTITSSKLLRIDNRGVCQQCHNK